MRTLKKVSALLIAFVMLIAMALPVSAEPGGTNGSITISNAVEGQTYKVYRMLDLVSYNETEGAYLYNVNDSWKNFFTNGGEGAAYVVIDSQGCVTWNAEKKTTNDMVTFAKAALAWANNNKIAADGTQKATDTTVTFSNLGWGYYLVDSSLGTLCSIDTTAPDAEIQEKNGEPIVEKEVQEDNTNNWGESNTAQIGDTVNFKTTITAQAGAQNYVLHDKMTAGLTFNSITSVTKGGTTLTEGTDYTVDRNPSDGCTFHVTFTPTFCDTLTSNDSIVVNYTAVLNENAKVGVDDEDENKNVNDTYLGYGDGNETTHDNTTTYTFKFQIIKTNKGSAGEYTVLDGAQFSLYRKADSKDEDAIKFVKNGTEYRVAKTGETGTTTVIEAGSPIIKGLDAQTYYLQEDVAPSGFNKITTRKAVTLTTDNVVDENGFKNDTVNNQVIYLKDHGGVQVINESGAKLPTTGGIGTTIIYILGAVLVLGAGGTLYMMNRKNNDRKSGRR